MNQKIYLFFTLFISCFCADFNAQEFQKFKGKYELKNIGEGIAEFKYFIKQKDTVFDGEFSFSKMSEIDDHKESIIYDGNFKNNKMQGEWMFSLKTIDSISDPKAKDFELVSTTAGSEFLVSGIFENNKQNGTWQVIQRKFENSKPTDTSFTAEIDFGQKSLKQNFNSDAKNMSVIGGFNGDGLVHGDWTMIHKLDGFQVREIREFENGAMKNHYFLVNNDKIFVDYIGLDTSKNTNNETWTDQEFDQLYTEVLKLANISSYTPENTEIQLDELSSISLDFIKNTFLSFYQHQDYEFWSAVSQKTINDDQKTVSLRKYPFSKSEKKDIKNIKSDFEEIKNKIDSFNEESLVEIGLHQYKTLKITNEIYKLISTKLDDLQHNVSISQNKALAYLERSSLDDRVFKKIEFPETISVEFQNESVETDTNLPISFEPESFELSDFSEFINTIKNSVKELDSESDLILDDLKKQSKLNEIEEELVAKKDSILKLYSANQDIEKFNEYHDELDSEIKNYTRNQFETYASLEIDQKKEQIDLYLECFDEIISFYKMQTELPSKIDRIKDLYTRTVWNPYTYTDMQETVKERIYESFDEILLPHLLEKFNNEIDCESISKNIKNFNNLYKRMVEIREQDTKQIEKALKREKNPMLIFEILSVNYTE